MIYFIIININIKRQLDFGADVFFLRQKINTLAMVNKKRHTGSRKTICSRSNSSCAERNLGNFHFKEDREILLGINNTVNELKDEIITLRHELDKAKKEVTQVKTENARLKQAINLNIYSQDDLDQHNRRENIRIYGVPESSGKRNDGEDILFQIAKELDIELDAWDVQRCHRLGRKPNRRANGKWNNGCAKPRRIIARFVSFKKRNEFMFTKAELKKSENFHNCFITEDLTQLRYKLLNYVKNNCNSRFFMCSSYNGKIRMKESAKTGDASDSGKDEGRGYWVAISSPDDLFKLGFDEIDFKALNYQPLFINRSDFVAEDA